MKPALGLRLGQSLTMTPALQQAIRLLQLSSLDLQQEIEQALESNILLERDDEAEDPSELSGEQPGEVSESPVDKTAAEDTPALELREDGDIPDEMPVDAAWEDVFDDLPAAPRSGDDDELRDFLEANLHRSTGLYEHLLDQARAAPFSPGEAAIAEYLIDAIDDDGYLREWPTLRAQIVETLHVPGTAVDAVLATLQEFDPTGVAARDLQECLRLQIEALPARTPGAMDALLLIEKHMALLGNHALETLVRASGLPLERVDLALTLIKTLQPHPGRPYQPHENEYVTPDVFVIKREGRWSVRLNTEHMPRLRLSDRYRSMIRRADSSQDQQTLRQHLQEARYFINSLEARNETLLRVSQSIVEEQRAFLEYGPEAMRPLVLRDISERLGIHESTVSRATANKFMLTPRGLFELKHFFSSHVQTTSGGACSATAIQAMIKRMIGTEDVLHPLSDSTLSQMLLKEGIQVARRTVAKYREGLGISPSHERKPPG